MGGAGSPVIGVTFPDTDGRHKDADSRLLLKDVMLRVHKKGFRACNLDVIVHAEAPKLSPYKRRMAESIAALVGLSPDDVSVKAKTNEGMGPLGQSDAIACTAVASLRSCGA